MSKQHTYILIALVIAAVAYFTLFRGKAGAAYGPTPPPAIPPVTGTGGIKTTVQNAVNVGLDYGFNWLQQKFGK